MSNNFEIEYKYHPNDIPAAALFLLGAANNQTACEAKLELVENNIEKGKVQVLYKE